MTPERGSSTRTVVLGFDALDFDYLDRFRDDLPNFERLLSDGVSAPLESSYPPWTGSAWPSMYTGTDPSHHGVYGFFNYDGYPDEGSIVTRNDVAAPAVWNYLTSVGSPSVVLNVPVTHPAEPIDGALVPGYLAEENAPGYPPGVRSDLDAALGEPYRIYSTHETGDDDRRKLAGYLDLIDLRKRAAVELLDSRPWEFAFVQVQKTDAVFHNFDDDASFRAVYRAADDLVGAVLDAVDDTVDVIVCSDHGIGPVTGHRIYLNAILRDHGFVEETNDGGRRSFTDEKARLAGGSSSDEDATSPVARSLSLVGSTLARSGLASGAYAAAERLGVASTVVDLVPDGLRDGVVRGVDWRASRAYCASGTRLGVRVNLVGRDPEGVVPASEYESVRSDLIDILSRVRTPDGRPAFDAVVRREEVYDGPLASRAPDVLTVPRDFDNELSVRLYGQSSIPVDKFGHKRDGVFIGAGPGFDARADAAVDRLSLTDVAPIAMAVGGHPVPERMTGAVPDGLLSTTVRRTRYDDVTHGDGVTDETDEGGVTERLEDLGYL